MMSAQDESPCETTVVAASSHGTTSNDMLFVFSLETQRGSTTTRPFTQRFERSSAISRVCFSGRAIQKNA